MMRPRFAFGLAWVGMGLWTLLAPMGAAVAAPPNILFIVADDMGYGDLGCTGAPDINTPHIDALADQGVRWTQFYANGPECTPTRTAFLTGRYQQRVGGLECAIGTDNVGRYDDAIRLADNRQLGLPTSQVTIVQLLKSVGYATCITGKWHLGYEEKFSPNAHGFDHAFYIEGGNCDFFRHQEVTGRNVLRLNGELITRPGHMTDLITEEALSFLGRQTAAQPFFLYMPYTAPHSPYQLPGQDTGELLSAEAWNQGTREQYAAMVEHMDQGIGRILGKLDDMGLAENTLVIFISDNGGVRFPARNAPYSGAKSGLFEGGIRVPAIARWPGVLPAGQVSGQVTATFDLTASMAKAAGVAPPLDAAFDGVPMIQWAAQGRIETPRTIHWRSRRADRTWRAVRSGAWKYIRFSDSQDVAEYLFYLESDPAEQHNLIDQETQQVKRLRESLAQWEQDVEPAR